MPPTLDKPDLHLPFSPSPKDKPQANNRQKSLEEMLGGGAQGHDQNKAVNSLPAQGESPPAGKENRRQPVSTPLRPPPQMPSTANNSEPSPKMMSTEAASRCESPVPLPVTVAIRPARNKATSIILSAGNGSRPYETPIPLPFPVATQLLPPIVLSKSPLATQNAPNKDPTPSTNSRKRIASQNSPLLGHAEKKPKTTPSAATSKSQASRSLSIQRPTISQPDTGFRRNSATTPPPLNVSESIQQFLSAQSVQDQQKKALHSAKYGSLPPVSSPTPSSHTFPPTNHSYASCEPHLPFMNHNFAQANTLQGGQEYVSSPLFQFPMPSPSHNTTQLQLQSLSLQGAPKQKSGVRADPDSITQYSQFRDALRLRKSRDTAQNTRVQSQRQSKGISRLDLQPDSARTPECQARRIPQQPEYATSPPTIPSVQPKGIQAEENPPRRVSRPAPLAGLSKRLISDSRHFLLYFGKYIGYPNIFLPRTDIDQCVDNILEILRSYHAIEKILHTDGWELAQVHREGYRFGFAVFKVSLDLPGYNNVSNMMPHVAKYFQDQEQAAEKQIEQMGSKMLDEFNIHGRASWYYAQQMERAFFSQAKLAVIDLSRRAIEEQREAAAVEIQREVRQEDLTKRYEGVWHGKNTAMDIGETSVVENAMGMAILPGGMVEPRDELMNGDINKPVDIIICPGMANLPGGVMLSREEVMAGDGVRPMPNRSIHSSSLAIPPGFRAPSPSAPNRHFGKPMSDPRLQGTVAQAASMSFDSLANSRLPGQGQDGSVLFNVFDLVDQPAVLKSSQVRHIKDHGRGQNSVNSGKPTPVRYLSPDYDPLMEGIVEGLSVAVKANAEAAVVD